MAGTAAGHAFAQTPAEWIDRMNQALMRRNYDATFTHWQGGRVEMMRIVHRLQGNTTSERLVSLDGSGREFLRVGPNLTCYLPDRRVVLVEQRAASGPLLGGFPAINPRATGVYDLHEAGRTRFNRRETRVITVLPRDEYRYGYRLWIDEESAMPLKTQLCDTHGHVFEQMVFSTVSMPASIPDAAFRSEVDTSGFRWLREEGTPPGATPLGTNPSTPTAAAAMGPTSGVEAVTTAGPQPLAAVEVRAGELPPGFRVTGRSGQRLPGSSVPVEHVVLSDGLASVSVFIESQPTEAGVRSRAVESARIGSSSAFSTVFDGYKVTAVGEVPPATVRAIAAAVRVPAAEVPPAGRPGAAERQSAIAR